jgi:hypothetical protein
LPCLGRRPSAHASLARRGSRTAPGGLGAGNSRRSYEGRHVAGRARHVKARGGKNLPGGSAEVSMRDSTPRTRCTSTSSTRTRRRACSAAGGRRSGRRRRQDGDDLEHRLARVRAARLHRRLPHRRGQGGAVRRLQVQDLGQDRLEGRHVDGRDVAQPRDEGRVRSRTRSAWRGSTMRGCGTPTRPAC